MMRSTLQSDAEAFKAANLNAEFEDFIRWYSPNDWEECLDEEGVKQPKLSARMKAEGNTWHMVWEQAKPVPVARQVGNETHVVKNYVQFISTMNANLVGSVLFYILFGFKSFNTSISLLKPVLDKTIF